MNGLRRVVSFLMEVSRGVSFARTSFFLVVVLGAAVGLGNTALIALINAQLSGRTANTRWLIVGFCALCVVMPLSRFASDLLLLRLTQRSIFSMRLRLCRRILQTPLRRLEALGAHRLLASLTNDVGSITTALVNIPLLSMHSMIVVGCLVYLGWLSWVGLLVVLGFLVVGVALYQWPMFRADRHFDRSRKSWNALFKGLKALTEGTKELKLHRLRRGEFVHEELEASSRGLERHGYAGSAWASVATSIGQIIFFVLIGLVVFVIPRFHHLASGVLTGYALTILYMMTPLESVLNLFPHYSRARVAVDQIEKLGLSLVEAGDVEVETESDPEPDWQELVLDGVAHTYFREEVEDRFTLGPVDLSLHPGELVFLVGGNGSGKTTLAKLLIGLYEPEQGEIRLDGEAVTLDTRDRYRQHFAVVFNDFYLFESLLGLKDPTTDAAALDYLRQLHLDKKVEVRDGTLSTIELSQGQRKRLALLTAYLEDRPIYLFDEWAADQDPHFKEVFYRQLLPDLKARGKTVVVISHDDRYYDVADRIIKLDYGQVVEDSDDASAPVLGQEVRVR